MADPASFEVNVTLGLSATPTLRQRIIQAAQNGGFVYRHGAGIDMLLDPGKPSARSAIHLIFLGEKVRPGDPAKIPASDPICTKEGIWISPVADLVRMKLTSFRLKDKVNLQDLDSVGLIIPGTKMRRRREGVRSARTWYDESRRLCSRVRSTVPGRSQLQ